MIEQRVADYVAHFSAPENRGFDVYHAHDGLSGNALATLKAEGLIGGYVRTVHHLDDFADPRIAALQARSIREADAWMTVSAHVARRPPPALRRRGEGRRQRRRPDAVPPGRGRTRAGASAAVSASGPGPIFLCVGGVEARKNTLRMLEAFAELALLRPDAELVIAGGASLLDHDAYQRAFAERLASLGPAAASVRRLGVIADRDMPRLYRLASALVFASVKEGFGLCVLEAMASGVPVVAPSIEPFLGYLAPQDALWCDPMNVQTIADAMALALCDDAARNLRARGPMVAARFDWRAVAEAHEPQYRRLLEAANA